MTPPYQTVTTNTTIWNLFLVWSVVIIRVMEGEANLR